MKYTITTTLVLFFSISLFAQKTSPDLSEKAAWKTYNRTTTVHNTANEPIYLSFDAQQGDGLSVYQNLNFENGTIELDIKGKNVPGKSFVGIAFHIQDEKKFNAIYFRPFNFKSPEEVRRGHSVQYISHPEFTWRKLRTDFPEQFENAVNPVPEPDNWFHAKVVVKWPTVKVFVDGAKEPSLEVKMKSTFKSGKIGFWVGYNSDGAFKNLTVTKDK